MAAPEKSRPRLKKLDDLFLLDKDNGSDNNATQPVAPGSRYHELIELDKLVPFTGHPFNLYEGERLEDMIESIKVNGVLIPIIVRDKDGRLEILAGHNRVNASKLAGLKEIPAIILQNISDEEAWIYVVETNLMQRSFADMSHSEKAAVINVQHSKLFSQGKRNDILTELNALENAQNPHENNKNKTCEQVAQKLTSRENVAKEYGLSKDTVARYLRIHKLIPALKTLLDCGVISFIPAVTLSFLKEREQKDLAYCIELNGFSCDMKTADILRKYSQDGKLDEDSIFLILNGELGKKPKPNRTPAIKVNKAVYARFFTPNQTAKEVQDIVEKALEMYFANG